MEINNEKIFELVQATKEQVVLKVNDVKDNLTIATHPYIKKDYDYINVTRGKDHTLTIVYKNGDTLNFCWGRKRNDSIDDMLKWLKKEVCKFIEKDCHIFLDLNIDKIETAKILDKDVGCQIVVNNSEFIDYPNVKNIKEAFKEAEALGIDASEWVKCFPYSGSGTSLHTVWAANLTKEKPDNDKIRERLISQVEYLKEIACDILKNDTSVDVVNYAKQFVDDIEESEYGIELKYEDIYIYLYKDGKVDYHFRVPTRDNIEDYKTTRILHLMDDRHLIDDIDEIEKIKQMSIDEILNMRADTFVGWLSEVEFPIIIEQNGEFINELYTNHTSVSQPKKEDYVPYEDYMKDFDDYEDR